MLLPVVALHTVSIMASLARHPSGFYCVSFRYLGRRFYRSLQTDNEAKARRALAGIEETLSDVGRGRVAVPDKCSPDQLWQIVRSGGRLKALPAVLQTKTLEQITEEYFASYPDDAKEKTSLMTERCQFNNLLRLLGNGLPIHAVDVTAIEVYIAARQKEKGLYGRKLSAKTIHGELQILRQLWHFAEEREYVSGHCPVDRVRRPKSDAQLPFATWSEIERMIRRAAKMTDAQKAELWSCLYLSEDEVLKILAHVRRSAEPMAYPVFAFVAFTGCRRSEMMRAHIDDVDFPNGTIQIREKKKSRSLAVTYRRVEMHDKLKGILRTWIRSHPGGQWLFPSGTGEQLTPKEAAGLFNRSVAGSQWEVVEGYHVFRHSFASSCARRGIPQAYIDAWMGHTTLAMQQRYRHLFPADRKAAIAALFA